MIEGFKKISEVPKKIMEKRKEYFEPTYVMEGEAEERQEKYGDFTKMDRLFGPEVWQGKRGEQIASNYLQQFSMPFQQIGSFILGGAEHGVNSTLSPEGGALGMLLLNAWKMGRPIAGMFWDKLKERRQERRQENYSGNDIGEITA